MIHYAQQNIDNSDVDAVVEVLNSNFLTQGPQVPIFENALSEYAGAKSAVAVNSATAALHLACLGLGLGDGDIIWTSPNTFVASANVARMCGARVDFVDIDSNTRNMCVNALERKLEEAYATGCLPKIVMPVHFAGVPCDMEAISRLSKKFNFYVVEDASHALGSCFKNNKIGNCKFSDVTVFSFHPVKSITCGEGGALLTNCPSIDQRARLLRSHGVSRDMADASRRPWEYSQTVLGYNYRMSDINAALGINQLRKLDLFVKRRNLVADRYTSVLDPQKCLKLGKIPKDTLSAYHLFVIELIDDLKDKRDVLYSLMVEAGITPGVHYIPVHTQPYYQSLGFKKGDFPIAENYYACCLSLPLHPGLGQATQDHVIDVLMKNIEYLRSKK